MIPGVGGSVESGSIAKLTARAASDKMTEHWQHKSASKQHNGKFLRRFEEVR